VNEALGATYAVGEREGGYSVSLPVSDNVRVDLGGPGRVNVSQILYDPQGNIVGYKTIVRNDVIQSALEAANSPEERQRIESFFEPYRDNTILSDNPAFNAIGLSLRNDEKITARLQFVPAKIVGAGMGVGADVLGSTGISSDVLARLQEQQNRRQGATELLPEDMR
jgi:hypothetical protein